VENVWQVSMPVGLAMNTAATVLLVNFLVALLQLFALHVLWVNTEVLCHQQRSVLIVQLAGMLVVLAAPHVHHAKPAQFLVLLAVELAFRVQSDNINPLLAKSPVELVILVNILSGMVILHVQVVRLVNFLLRPAVELVHHVQLESIQILWHKLRVQLVPLVNMLKIHHLLLAQTAPLANFLLEPVTLNALNVLLANTRVRSQVNCA
jgi:phosphotransferase system HPr-like phosphotransfer protein